MHADVHKCAMYTKKHFPLFEMLTKNIIKMLIKLHLISETGSCVLIEVMGQIVVGLFRVVGGLKKS